MKDAGNPIPAHNDVALASNGVVVAVGTGQQTTQSVSLLSQRLAKKVAPLRKQPQRKVLILVDLSRVTGYDTGASQATQELLLHMDFDAMAVFGASKAFRAEATALVASAHQSHSVQFFSASDAAARWLAGDVIQQKSSVKSLAHPVWPSRRKKRTI